MKVLDEHKINHRFAFQSGSFAGLQAALRAGIAIGLLPKSCLGDGLQILTKAHGLPKLPISCRSILISDGATKDIATAMVAAIRSACQR